MQLVDFSLRRRVTVAMSAVAMVLFGLVAFTRLQVSLLPDLSYPSLTIETTLSGAAPAEVEQLVTRPIEERVGVVSGVQRITSVSSPGLSQVTMEFGWGRDMNFAAIDVREKLDMLRLPDGVQAPVLRRYDPSADPILRLYLTSDSPEGVDLLALRRLAEERVEKDLESTEGVAAIDVRGGYEAEIEIEIDEGRLALTGLDLATVNEQLSKANVDQAGGSLYEREARYLVRAHNRFGSLEDIRSSVLIDRDGRRVTIGDIATVRRTHQQRETVTRLGGTEAIELAIFREGDANTTTVAEAVHGRLELIRDRLPAGAVLVVAADQSTFIEASVNEVLMGAGLGGVFAVLVLLLFLRDLRSTAIIAVSIPVSVIATFFLMYQTGTTLNVMSLGGLALGVGMLVDSAIVVLEAIHRRREQGASALDAARLGAGEVGRAVVASTLTTVAVFLPVVFLEGVAAQLFRDMAVTVCFSLLVSLAVSLTLIPMISALSSGERPETPAPGRLARVLAYPVFLIRLGLQTLAYVPILACRPLVWLFDAVFGQVVARYPSICRAAVRRPFTVVGIALLAFVATLLSVPRLGLDLIPSLSQGEFGFVVELPAGTPLDVTDALVDRAQRDLVDDPRVAQVSTVAGQGAASSSASASRGEHTAVISVRMAVGADSAAEEAVIEQLRTNLVQAGARRFRLTRPAVFSLRRPVELQVFTTDLEQLRAESERLRAQLAEVPGVVEARSSAEFGNPEIQVRFDREAIAKLDLTVSDIATTVRGKLQGDVTTRFREGHRDVDIRVRALPRKQASPEDLRRMIVAHKDGAPIVLESVAAVELGTGPSEIRRVDQSRAAVVSADVTDRDMGAVAQDVQAIVDDLSLPVGVDVQLAGQEQEMFQSLRSLLMATALAGFLVYLVMASQFESLLHPFIVILTLPLGAIGVVGSLLLTGSSLSVVSMVGVVMLAGIVVNNAIVLVDAINQRREAGEPRMTAIVGAGRDRLRPILMTSATTILGLLPMALASGAGAELRQALALAVIGGLVVATALTLVVVPAVYRLIDRKRFEQPEDAS